MISETKRLLLASTLLMGLPATLHAQEAAPAATVDQTAGQIADRDATGSDTIVVTGSRLTSPALRQAAPIVTVSAQDIALSGQSNIENVLKELPQMLPGETAASNNPGHGVATANLRGLGASRTLVLVNGHRYVPYDTNQIVDLNTIPAPLIEQTDVVTGGKSAVYGSDAVTGVVNFRTKQNYQGVQANANYRLTDKGDGGQFSGGILAGTNFAQGRGNITLYGEYSKRNAIKASKRDYTSTVKTDSPYGLVDGGSAYVPAGMIALNSGYYIFNQDGSVRDFTGGSDLYNYATENYIQTPQKRELLFGQGHFDVSDTLTVYAEGQYIHNRVKNQLAPTTLSGTYDLDTDSSFLSASSQALLASEDSDGDGYTTAGVYRRLSELGDRIQIVDSKAYRGLLGLKGALNDDWNFDAYASFARTDRTETQYGNVSASRVAQALKTTYDDEGNLVCADVSNGCVPLNIFGAGNMSAAAASFIALDTVNRSRMTEIVASGVVTNDHLFDLGAGNAGIALGAEFRREHGAYRPDAAFASGDVIGFSGSQAASGGYSVSELFAELDVPLIADRPFIDRLEVIGSGRYSYYTTKAKSVGTYSGGLVWAPIHDFALRGQYSRAVRAPTVNDLYSGGTSGYQSASDPCATDTATSNASLNASCAGSGIPADHIGSSNYYGGQILSYGGGNDQLREETAKTYTLGMLVQPRVIPKLSFSVDYYHIRIDNFITNTGLSNIIAACYGTQDNGWVAYDSSYCSLLPRDSGTYAISGAVDKLTNTGGVTTDGIDFDAQYRIPLGFGVEGQSNLDLRMSGTRLLGWDYQPIANISDLKLDCAGKFGLKCGSVYAKWHLNGRATWSTKDVSVSLAWRHLSSVDDDNTSTTYSTEHIKAFDYFDLATSFKVAGKFTWTLGMTNMFDRKPPMVGDNQEQSNTFPSTYDLNGRTLFASVVVDL